MRLKAHSCVESAASVLGDTLPGQSTGVASAHAEESWEQTPADAVVVVVAAGLGRRGAGAAVVAVETRVRHA